MITLRFGIVSGEAGAAETLARVCASLARILGVEITSVVLAEFADLRAQLLDGAIDLAWSPPISAVQLELEGKARIAVGVARGRGATYSSAIFTLASSSIAKVEDLRGKRMAWVDRESAAGYLVPKLRLEALGLEDAAFASQTFEGAHEAVVRAVVAGRADAGATYVSFAPVRGHIESAGWLRAEVPMHDIRILATAGPIPPDVILISRRVEAPLHDSIVEALVSLAADHDVADLFAGNGFVMVGSYQYDGLRALLEG